MSDKISITGIRGFGYHGVFESERREGQEFIVDVELTAKLKKLNDDLSKTIDYSKVIEIVHADLISNPVNLIETIGERIAEKLLSFDKKIKEVTVTVHKPSAPIAQSVADISISIHKSR